MFLLEFQYGFRAAFDIMNFFLPGKDEELGVRSSRDNLPAGDSNAGVRG
jgi:hypothetical protein